MSKKIKARFRVAFRTIEMVRLASMYFDSISSVEDFTDYIFDHYFHGCYFVYDRNSGDLISFKQW